MEGVGARDSARPTVSGHIHKRRAREEVGLRATLLVDPGRPERFLVLDTVM